MKTKFNLYSLCLLLFGLATCKVSTAQTTPTKTTSNPIVSFAGKKDGESITAAELRNAKYVDCKIENLDGACPIVSFSISVRINGSTITETGNNGSSLSEKQITLLSKAKKGNKIYIEKIIVQQPGGAIVDLGSIYLKVI